MHHLAPVRRPLLLVVALCVAVLLGAGAPPSTASVRARTAGLDAVWPLDPRPEVVRVFHPPATAWGPGHRGVDLLGRVGQQVRAARAGRITFAARLAGRGVVVVDHGATRTTYEPVTPTVRVGDRVGRGQPIGRLQRGGSHCAPRACLHWGWLRGRVYLDPLLLVGGGPVRLLPLRGALAPRAAALPGVPLRVPPPQRVRAPALRAALAVAEVGAPAR